jgi:hypothetical protein
VLPVLEEEIKTSCPTCGIDKRKKSGRLFPSLKMYLPMSIYPDGSAF